MKKIIVSVLLYSFLFASTEIGELLKLPMLVHHYIEHLDTNKNLSFFGFLDEHYSEYITHPDGKHADHEKLPFKSGTCCNLHIVTTAPEFTDISIKPQLQINIKKLITIQQADYYNHYLDNIWQPPKFC